MNDAGSWPVNRSISPGGAAMNRLTPAASTPHPGGTRPWLLGLGVVAIFVGVGGETQANKHAIAAFHTRWEQPSAAELILSVDPASVTPPAADLASHTLAVEAAGPLAASSVADWHLITNLPSGLERFTVNPFATNVAPVFYRLKLSPR